MLSIWEIASRFVERHGQDYERKITPHWVGHVIRRKLGLKTERRPAGYVVASTEGPKLARLFEKYGIVNPDETTSGDPMNCMNSMNSMNFPDA